MDSSESESCSKANFGFDDAERSLRALLARDSVKVKAKLGDEEGQAAVCALTALDCPVGSQFRILFRKYLWSVFCDLL